MSKEKTYPNWSTYGFCNAKTAEKIKLKGQEILKELLQKRNQNKDECN